jgi:hypothetical protein
MAELNFSNGVITMIIHTNPLMNDMVAGPPPPGVMTRCCKYRVEGSSVPDVIRRLVDMFFYSRPAPTVARQFIDVKIIVISGVLNGFLDKYVEVPADSSAPASTSCVDYAAAVRPHFGPSCVKSEKAMEPPSVITRRVIEAARTFVSELTLLPLGQLPSARGAHSLEHSCAGASGDELVPLLAHLLVSTMRVAASTHVYGLEATCDLKPDGVFVGRLRYTIRADRQSPVGVAAAAARALRTPTEPDSVLTVLCEAICALERAKFLKTGVVQAYDIRNNKFLDASAPQCVLVPGATRLIVGERTPQSPVPLRCGAEAIFNAALVQCAMFGPKDAPLERRLSTIVLLEARDTPDGLSVEFFAF